MLIAAKTPQNWSAVIPDAIPKRGFTRTWLTPAARARGWLKP
jgi:hypothetical protein